MAKFRKKPVIVDATQWHKNGDHPDDRTRVLTDEEGNPFYSEGEVVRRFRRPKPLGSTFCSLCGDIFHVHGWIDTLEGGHIVCPGDWIITGVHGERYPCKPDIFEKTYDRVEDE